ncbi:MAG TPA: hypothetical protein PKA64_13230 [Myxococcota bacterium]|nr:hypothetical protein [Myxococcota bacterium]
MTFEYLFPTATFDPSPADLDAWLTSQGEPCEEDGAARRLRALPVELRPDPVGLRAGITLTPDTPLPRLVGLLFELALWLGTDLHRVGAGRVTRGQAWMQLADEQDRLRLARAIDRAGGRIDDVLHGLWTLLQALGRGRDLRWDPRMRRIAELAEVHPPGDDDEITVTDSTDPDTVLAFPLHGGVHTLAWRWLSDAFPSLSS